MATLFPEEAIRPRREADPLREEDMLEKVSDYSRDILMFVYFYAGCRRQEEEEWNRKGREYLQYCRSHLAL